MHKNIRKYYLRFLILAVMIVMSTMGYIRLYSWITNNAIALPFSFSLASIMNTTKVEKKVFGSSVKGKPIEGYEIGSGQDVILLLASMHGDEVGTVDLLNQLVTEIKANPNLVSKTKKLIVIPITNPDGYYDRKDKLNANEVNLNLNFATHDWKKYGPEGTYAGSKPFSEPESQAIKQVVEQYNPSMMIAYHAFGDLVTPEDQDASMAMGKWYAEKTGYHYFDDTNFDWDYPGTATKWFVEITGKPAITVEITSYTESDWDINKKALLELIS